MTGLGLGLLSIALCACTEATSDSNPADSNAIDEETTSSVTSDDSTSSGGAPVSSEPASSEPESSEPISSEPAGSESDPEPEADPTSPNMSNTGGTSSAEPTSGAGGSSSAAGGSTTGGAGGSAEPPAGEDLSGRYPGDVGLAADPAVLFYDDFETGWGRWDGPSEDTNTLFIESNADTAFAGSGYLRSTVTTADLDAEEYISSSTHVTFERRVDEVYWRFYAHFPNVAANPHHWIRLAAGNEEYGSSGLANTVPPGDEGFWLDFDADNDDRFNFYVYWYNMRSGRCNDGSATPGCEGDQGTTYYYGNVFQPPEQQPFPRAEWFCVEIHAKANTVGSSDGELSFWVNDELIGDYRPGFPDGTWLRAQFHTDGCDFSACTPPAPFEGFDFRSASDVGFKSMFLDAYYERGSNADKRAELESRGLTLSDEQTILYDNVVVATERVGCTR